MGLASFRCFNYNQGISSSRAGSGLHSIKIYRIKVDMREIRD